jgi:hypothetical protein
MGMVAEEEVVVEAAVVAVEATAEAAVEETATVTSVTSLGIWPGSAARVEVTVATSVMELAILLGTAPAEEMVVADAEVAAAVVVEEEVVVVALATIAIRSDTSLGSAPRRTALATIAERAATWPVTALMRRMANETEATHVSTQAHLNKLKTVFDNIAE